MENRRILIYIVISLLISQEVNGQKVRLIPEHIPLRDCSQRDWHLSQPTDSIFWFTDTLCSQVDLEFLHVECDDSSLQKLVQSTLDNAFLEYFFALFEDDVDEKWNHWIDTFFVDPQHHSPELYVSTIQYWLKKNFIEVNLGMYDLTEGTEILTVGLGYDAFTGGAHPFRSSKIFNFDIQQAKRIELSDCFTSETLPLIEKFAYMVWLQNDPDSIFGLTDYDFFISPNFIFDSSGLHLLYDAYDIGPYALGPPEIIIPMEICKPLLRSDCKIATIYK